MQGEGYNKPSACAVVNQLKNKELGQKPTFTKQPFYEAD